MQPIRRALQLSAITDSLQLTPFAAYRADDGYANGTWNDRTSGGRHWGQSTTANRPTLVTNVVNGRSVLRLDGADDFLDMPNSGASARSSWRFMHSNAGMHVFMVVVPRAANSSVHAWLCNTDTTATNTGFALYHQGPASNNGTSAAMNGSGTRLFLNTSGTIAKDVPVIREVMMGGGVWSDVVNGVTIGSGPITGSPAAGDASANLQIGRFGTNAAKGQIDVAELVIYDRVLSAQHLALQRTFLSTRYAIAV